jgi:hypothetical protein
LRSAAITTTQVMLLLLPTLQRTCCCCPAAAIVFRLVELIGMMHQVRKGLALPLDFLTAIMRHCASKLLHKKNQHTTTESQIVYTAALSI